MCEGGVQYREWAISEGSVVPEGEAAALIGIFSPYPLGEKVGVAALLTHVGAKHAQVMAWSRIYIQSRDFLYN